MAAAETFIIYIILLFFILFNKRYNLEFELCVYFVPLDVARRTYT